MVATFESDLNMSKAAANTYYQTIRTRLGIEKVKPAKAEKKADKKGQQSEGKADEKAPAPQKGSKKAAGKADDKKVGN